MFKTLLLLLAGLWSHCVLVAQSDASTSDNSSHKPSSEVQAKDNASAEVAANANEKLDVTIIKKLRELDAKLANLQQDSPSYPIVSKELNELSAKYHREWKFINDQKEQDKANRTLSPAEYDNWKQQKHAPKN